MPKRTRSSAGSLTGGTGDVNPQILNSTVAMAVANTSLSVQIGMPIQRQKTGGKAQVMEVLRVWFNHTAFEVLGIATETTRSITAVLTTKNFGATNVVFTEPSIVAYMNKYMHGAFTAGGTYYVTDNTVVKWTLHDGAGHGHLVATDNMFLQIQSVLFTAAAACNIKIQYRFKDVGLAEYIGIVQGQQ